MGELARLCLNANVCDKYRVKEKVKDKMIESGAKGYTKYRDKVEK